MRSERGFTVIELMIALAVSALLLTVVYQSFNATEQARLRIEAGNEGYHLSRVLASRIGRELQSLQFRSGDTESRFHSGIDAGVQVFEFSSRASTPLAARSGLLSQIAYRLRTARGDEPGPYVLERSERSALTPDAPRLLRLASGIKALTFRFYAAGRWQDDWDSEQSGSLPEAVSLAVERDDSTVVFQTAWPLVAFGG